MEVGLRISSLGRVNFSKQGWKERTLESPKSPSCESGNLGGSENFQPSCREEVIEMGVRISFLWLIHFRKVTAIHP